MHRMFSSREDGTMSDTPTFPNQTDNLCLYYTYGNLKLPPPPQRPYIYYADGDSVPFVVTESISEFKHLIGNHTPLLGQELEGLVPKLPSPSVTFCHVAADGRAFGHITKSWASICRSLGDLTFIKNSSPDYSGDLIQDPRGIWSIFLKEILDKEPLTKMNPPTDNVRISPVISQSHVEMLKKWIARKCMEENEKDHPRLSTFVVTTAFIWVCLIKLHHSSITPDESVRNDDAIFLFVFQADCRDRLRLPTNYFGNCLKPCIATAKRSEIIGENGIFVTAKAIGREIQEFEKEPLKGVENWISSAKEVFNECEHYVTLAG
ncbi:hypothetical protein CRYUN_Cryun40dG0079100 [Craigia yunnanensis]